MMSRFFRRIGVTLKKDADIAREHESCGHKAPSQALAKPSGSRCRSFATGVHRRDLDHDQHDPALRLGRRMDGRLVAKDPARPWKTATFLAALRNDRIDAPCVFDGCPINRRAVSRLRRTVPGPDPQAQRHRRARQSGIAQRQSRAETRPVRPPARVSSVPSKILTRPQPDRAGLRQ